MERLTAYHQQFRRTGLGIGGLLMVTMLLASCGEAASPTTSTTDRSGTPTATTSPGSGDSTNQPTSTATTSSSGTPKPTPTSPPAPKPTPTATKPPAPKPTPTPKPKPSVHQVTVQQNVTSTGFTSVTVACPSGELALSGGWAAGTSDPGKIVASMRASSSSWQVYTSGPALVAAGVECLKNASGASVTEQSTGLFSVPANNLGTKYVSCVAGTVLVGGGFDTSNSASLTLYNLTASGSSWGGYVWNHGSSARFTRFFAECLTLSGATSSFLMSSNHSSGAVASCPSGSYVSGGGFVSNQSSYTYSAAANGNGWQVSITPATGMNVYAMCVKFS